MARPSRSLPPPGTFRLYPYANPPLPAGRYTLTGDVSGLPGPVESLHAALDVTAPRYALPPDQVLSTFPPASARGAFTSRLPQVVLRRRTLPWERSDRAVGGTPVPWLALVLLADGEGSLYTDVPVRDCVTPGVALDPADADVPKGTCLEVPAGVVAKVFPALEDLAMLSHVREVDLRDTELALGDDDGWMAVVLCNRLPQAGTRYTACLLNLEGQYGELPVDPPVAEEYVSVRSVVDLVAVREQIGRAGLSADAPGMGLGGGGNPDPPDAGTPGRREVGAAGAVSTGAGWATRPTERAVAAAGLSYEPVRDLAVVGTGIGLTVPWHLLERTLRFPVLASWSFTCTDAGDFQYLATNVTSRLLGHVATGPETPDGEPLPPGTDPPGLPAEPPSARPLPLVAATGHVATAHETRIGDRRTAWFRGPLAPDPVARAAARPDGRYPLAHHADQLRRVTPDGQEDLTYAAAFEIGRLLALSRPSVVAALNRWRRQRFAAASTAALASRIASAVPDSLRELLERPDPFLDPGDERRRGAGAGRRFARGMLAALGAGADDLAPARPLADPGHPVDDAGAVFGARRDARLVRGLALPEELREADVAAAADALWSAPVATAERALAADVAAARHDLEELAGRLADTAERLARGVFR